MMHLHDNIIRIGSFRALLTSRRFAATFPFDGASEPPSAGKSPRQAWLFLYPLRYIARPENFSGSGVG